MPLSSQFVHERLRASARKLRWSRSARFLIAGAALSLFSLVLFLTLDAWLHFGRAGRWTGLALTLTSLAGGGLLAWRSWRVAVSEASMARRIEQACGGGNNVLISAVQLDGTLPANSGLRAALFEEMIDPFPGVKWELVFGLKVLQRLALALGLVVALIFGWAVLRPGYFANSVARIFLPASNIAPLTRTKIENIIPGDDIVVHGRAVVLSAKLGGAVPTTAWLHFRETGSSWQKALMDREAGQPIFGYQWKEMRQPVEYYVEAGDARSETHRLDVRPKTAVKARTAVVEPPSYTGLTSQEVNDFSVLQNVIPGSTVTVTTEFNNEVGELKAFDEKGQAVEADRGDATHWKVRSRIMSNQTYKIDFRDVLGLMNTTAIQIAVKPDEPPKITITEPGEGQELAATPSAVLSVKLTATDELALDNLALYRSSDEREDAELIQGWPEAAGLKEFEATAHIPLNRFAKEERVTFRIIARDRNDVSGPGVTMSRPIVVSLSSPDNLEKQVGEAVNKLQQGLESLIKLQAQNLEESKMVARQKEGVGLTPLVERQLAVADGARKLVASAGAISPDVRDDLRSMLNKEMNNAVLALRNAGTAAGEARSGFLNGAIALEALILARLQGAPVVAEEEAKKGQVEELISGVEELLKRERALHKETINAPAASAPALGERQDALADKAVAVRKAIDADSRNAAIGDEDFRKRLAKVGNMFVELKIYEEMLGAAEHLQTQNAPSAVLIQQRVIANLGRMVAVLNQWQLAEAEERTADLKEQAEEMQQKLDKLAEIQREIVEKTRDMARKNDFRAEDVATASEIQEQKDLMKEVIEQMTTDMHAFPDMTPGNEMKSELVSIYEDVQQADKQELAEGKLKPSEIAVQKEQGILDAIEAAKKIAADIEMWLPNKNEKEKWLLENFDKTEMPAIPNLPLADAMEDIVGDLLETQEELEQDIQDAASNQAFAMNAANGWEIRDGPMPGFGAQGKSGNEKPNHNEQMGRSSGGREGMSNGEMAGDEASNLKGDSPDARRTKDPLQQGQVKDDGGIGQTKATGGGKAGGFSDREGMEGNAPVRAVKAASNPAADAAAVKQALLAQKTAKTVAQASLLYMRNDRLAEVAKMMDQNKQALKEGRLGDATGLHQKILARLRELKSGISSGQVVAFSNGEGSRAQDKQLLGGSEGEAPAQYKEMVADYFRDLVEEK